jgi:hypothetical protein
VTSVPSAFSAPADLTVSATLLPPNFVKRPLKPISRAWRMTMPAGPGGTVSSSMKSTFLARMLVNRVRKSFCERSKNLASATV